MLNQSSKSTMNAKVICVILMMTLFSLLLFSKRVEASETLQGGTPTPVPFLSAIFYGQEDVWQVFDHDLPLASGNGDNNNYVLHYDGTQHSPVTPTPNLTATPISPTPGPYIPDGYGYDEHGGIDFSLEYEPVLAAANGNVYYAGWDLASNHRAGYGLYVIIDHSSQEAYETWYGHLSVITVVTGDAITLDPDDPGNRNRIIGISGNTGSVFNIYGECATIPSGGATCGQHLHLEVRVHEATPVYKPVNPYGWVGATTPDPWATHPSGATSYNLWVTRPALVSGADQYPGAGDVGLPEPEVDEISLLIDDSSTDFTLEGECFTPTPVPGSQSYNNSYRYAEVNGDGECWAQWLIERDAFAPPGEYDIYVHIPDHEDASLDAVYTIEHNEETSIAHVVQLVYPNNEHSAWAYIGRYDFAMDGTITEYVQLDDDDGEFEDDDNEERIVLADAIKLVPAEPFQLLAETLYFSWANDVLINGTAYREEDIVAYDPRGGSWSLYFDGSDVGLENVDVDAFALLANGDILFSIDEAVEGLGEIEKAEDTDIIRFIPTSTGSTTEGDFAWYLAGTDFGLDDPISGPDRDIDAIGFTPEGMLLISTTNDVAELYTGYFSDEDLIYWDENAFIPVWVPYFDGSDVGLTDSGEDVNGTWLDPDTGDIYLTTIGSFNVTTLQGDREDLFICIPESIGATTSCDFAQPLYWNGSAHGTVPADSQASNFIVDGFAVVTPDCEEGINGGFERRFACWTSWSSNPGEIDWLVSTNAHTGFYSAEGLVVEQNYGSISADLLSEPFPVVANLEYCLSVDAKDIGYNPESDGADISVRWFNGQGTPITVDVLVYLSSDDVTTNWQQFTGSATAPNSAYTATLRLWMSSTTFTEEELFPYSLLVDDIIWEPC